MSRNARGMNMDEFRKSLESDARTENDKLKTQLRELENSHKRELADVTAEKDQYKEWCQTLCNRCFAQTLGSLCINCTVETCEHALKPDDYEAIDYYMRRNHIGKDDPNVCLKIGEFMRERRLIQMKESYAESMYNAEKKVTQNQSITRVKYGNRNAKARYEIKS